MTTLDLLPPQTNNYAPIAHAAAAYDAPLTLTVSIVIPFYKDLPVLAKTLASLINQTYPKHLIEVIVSDDGSPEPVAELLAEFTPFLTLHHVRQDDLGFRPAAARNLGMQHAQGDVIINIDFDMICPPAFVAAHLRWFHVSTEVATVGLRKFINTSHIRVDDVISNFALITQLPPCQSISSAAPTRDYDHRIRAFENFPHLTFPGYYFYGCNIAYWRRQALAIGGYDEEFDYNYGWEDVDFGHRLWLAGAFLVAATEAWAYHQENETVPLDQKVSDSPTNRIKFFKKFPDLRPAVRKKRNW